MGDIIMTAATNGNTSSGNGQDRFNEFWNILYPKLCDYTHSRVKDRTIAEDIVVETFIKYWQGNHGHESIEQAKSFLFTIINSKCIDHFRKINIHKVYKTEVLHLNGFNENKETTLYELKLELLRIIDKMPKQRRKVFKLIYFDGLNKSEVANKLGISENTVNNHQYEATKFVRKALENNQLLILFLFLTYDCIKN